MSLGPQKTQNFCKEKCSGLPSSVSFFPEGHTTWIAQTRGTGWDDFGNTGTADPERNRLATLASKLTIRRSHNGALSRPTKPANTQTHTRTHTYTHTHTHTRTHTYTHTRTRTRTRTQAHHTAHGTRAHGTRAHGTHLVDVRLDAPPVEVAGRQRRDGDLRVNMAHVANNRVVLQEMPRQRWKGEW